MSFQLKEKFKGRNLIQQRVCMTKDIGVHNNLFGGILLSWIDESAAGYVYRAIGGRPVVTLKISEVLFKAPIKVNDVVKIEGEITNIGRTSISITVTVTNTITDAEVCTTDLIFVHINENMKPTEI